MNVEMHGKKIAAVLWPDTETEKGCCLMVGYGFSVLRCCHERNA